MLEPVALQRAEIIAIAEFDERSSRIAHTCHDIRPELPREVPVEILLDAIVVQERVVNVHEEHEGSRVHGAATIAASMRAEAPFHPQSFQADADNISSLTRQRQLPPPRARSFAPPYRG